MVTRLSTLKPIIRVKANITMKRVVQIMVEGVVETTSVVAGRRV